MSLPRYLGKARQAPLILYKTRRLEVDSINIRSELLIGKIQSVQMHVLGGAGEAALVHRIHDLESTVEYGSSERVTAKKATQSSLLLCVNVPSQWS